VITRDCFEPVTAFLLLGSPEVVDEGFEAGTNAADAVDGFFAGFDMEILRSVSRGLLAAPPTPHLGQEAGGAGSLAHVAPTIGASTAPFSLESQSLLDKIIA
jgi:hypothetical protein